MVARRAGQGRAVIYLEGEGGEIGVEVVEPGCLG
jgi:hypothetical protein